MRLFRRSTLYFYFLRISILSVVALVVAAFILVRSSTTIIAPADPVAPVTVYITDYGYHRRLVLPTSQGKLLQYTYGDWDYFALNRQNWNNAIAALLIPTQGTLGRREFKDLAQLRQTLGLDWQDILLSLEVSSSRVFSLEQSLDIRFNQNIDTSIFNPHNSLTLVKDERNYSLWHNSNHELVSWLESLDCQVRGFVTLPNLQLQDTVSIEFPYYSHSK